MKGSNQSVVGLVNYGAGNLQSLANAIDHLGVQVRVLKDGQQLAGVTHVILPGVGAFGFCAERLRASGFLPALTEWALIQRRPILGICVGMQLLADTSEELGEQRGLGWLGGTIRKLVRTGTDVRIPHVGWNDVLFQEEFGSCPRGSTADFYFDHSYAYQAPVRGKILATCEHGQTFCAAVRHGNILGVQFHPEKSQTAGLRFIMTFLELEHA